MIVDKDIPFPLKQYLLTDKEIKVIELFRELKFGQCIIYIENGQPKRAENLKESIVF